MLGAWRGGGNCGTPRDAPAIGSAAQLADIHVAAWEHRAKLRIGNERKLLGGRARHRGLICYSRSSFLFFEILRSKATYHTLEGRRR